MVNFSNSRSLTFAYARAISVLCGFGVCLFSSRTNFFKRQAQMGPCATGGMSIGSWPSFASMRDKASATMLSLPATCTYSGAYSLRSRRQRTIRRWLDCLIEFFCFGRYALSAFVRIAASERLCGFRLWRGAPVLRSYTVSERCLICGFIMPAILYDFV